MVLPSLLQAIYPLSSIASAIARTQPNPDALSVCKALSAQYPTQVADSVLELSNLAIGLDYTSTRTDYWSQANADIKPACIFFPKAAKEVQFAVQTLNQYPNAPWAVKGGGHNPNVGFSSTQDGVLIATNEFMATTTLDSGNFAHVGAGCKWIDVARALDPHGRAVVSGRLGVVGVAGLSLGGGLSFLSTQYGFTADNIVEYEVVTAAGELTRANRQQNSDLFYALKGGGGQFALVTEFVMKTYPIGNVWGGHKIYTKDKKEAIINATHNLISNYYDPKAAVIVTFTTTVDTLVDIFVVFYFYDGPDGPGEILSEFNKIPALLDATSANRRYGDLLNSNSQFSIQGQRYLIRTGTLPNLPAAQGLDLYNYCFDSFYDGAKKAQSQELDNYAFSLAYQPVPVQLARASVNNTNGVNLLGLAPEYGDKVFMEYDVSWLFRSTDAKAAAILSEITEPVQKYGKAKYEGARPTNYRSGNVDFTNWNPLFFNDCMYSQDPLKSYGDATYERLRQIQKTRDPQGLFSKRTGGFKFR